MHAAVDPISTLPAPARENVGRWGCTDAEHTSACDTRFPLVERRYGAVCDAPPDAVGAPRRRDARRARLNRGSGRVALGLAAPRARGRELHDLEHVDDV